MHKFPLWNAFTKDWRLLWDRDKLIALDIIRSDLGRRRWLALFEHFFFSRHLMLCNSRSSYNNNNKLNDVLLDLKQKIIFENSISIFFTKVYLKLFRSLPWSSQFRQKAVPAAAPAPPSPRLADECHLSVQKFLYLLRLEANLEEADRTKNLKI